MRSAEKHYGSAAKKERPVFLRSISRLCLRRKQKGRPEGLPFGMRRSGGGTGGIHMLIT
jgi:hypothetical protein